MRIRTSAWPFLFILIGFLLAVIRRPSVTTVVLAVSVLGWAAVRALDSCEVFGSCATRTSSYKRASSLLAAADHATHILRNTCEPAADSGHVVGGLIILVESALSYLGAGVPPPTALGLDGVGRRGLIDTACGSRSPRTGNWHGGAVWQLSRRLAA